MDDVALYPNGQTYLQRQIIGLVKGYLPIVGTVSLMLKQREWATLLLAAVLVLVECFC